MNFSFINLTTALPVDCKLKEYFESKMSEEFRCALSKPNRFTDHFLKHTPIFFVCELPPEDGADSLGRYYPAHENFRQPVIEICPEKIFESFKINNQNRPEDYSNLKFYQCLVSSVIFHEISHLIMDRSQRGTSSKPRAPWNWAMSHPNIAEKLLRSTAEIFGTYETLPPSYSFIEETLANALMLKQKWDPCESFFLSAFTQTQPDGYNQCIQWVGSLQETLETSDSFSVFKHQRQLVYDQSKDINIQNLQQSIIEGEKLLLKKFSCY
jgi:hypothetical protein